MDAGAVDLNGAEQHGGGRLAGFGGGGEGNGGARGFFDAARFVIGGAFGGDLELKSGIAAKGEGHPGCVLEETGDVGGVAGEFGDGGAGVMRHSAVPAARDWARLRSSLRAGGWDGAGEPKTARSGGMSVAPAGGAAKRPRATASNAAPSQAATNCVAPGMESAKGRPELVS